MAAHTINNDGDAADNDIVIGIDLGTTNCCVAYHYNGRLRILESHEGDRLTPSVVYCLENKGTIVGVHAKGLMESRPGYAICEIKRLLGRKLSDPHVQNNLRYFPFGLDPESDDPIVLIEHPSQTLRKTPEEICTLILKKLKKDVEAKLSHEVTKVVITVPAYFNVSQREATLVAATQAGFTVLKLLNEPTAAALSYYYENYTGDHYSLVFDLGGGTFDVVILKKTATNIDIISVDGDSHLGGQDFDNLIIDYVADILKTDYNYDVRDDRRALRRLHGLAENAKKVLTSIEETTITLNGFVPHISTIEIPLSRQQFEEMADHLFTKTIRIVNACLESAHLAKSDIKEVILSGGSTRIPKIQEMLSACFDQKGLNKFVNPDECVAEGAALQAAMLSENYIQEIETVNIADITPLSLGYKDLVGVNSVLIKKNTRIPCESSVSVHTIHNNQTNCLFDICEGERRIFDKNRFLTSLQITNLTPAPPQVCNILLKFALDHNGILTITADETHKDNSRKLKVVYTRGQQSHQEIEFALKDAEEHKEEDNTFVINAVKRCDIITYCISCTYNLEVLKLTDMFKPMYTLCRATTKELLDKNFVAVERLPEIRQKVKDACESVVSKYKFKHMRNYL